MVLTLIASRTDGGKFLKILVDLCYPKWALEAFVIANAERYVMTISIVIELCMVRHLIVLVVQFMASP